MLSYFLISVSVLTTAMSAIVIPSTSTLTTVPSTKHEPLTPAASGITSRKMVVLPDVIRAFDKIDVSQVSSHYVNSYSVQKGGVMLFKNVEFGVTGASKVTVEVNLEKDVNEKLEFRIDTENGKVISAVPLSKVNSESTLVFNSTVVPVKGYHDLYLFYSGEVRASNISWFQFEVSGPNPDESYVLTSMWNGQAISAELTKSVEKGWTRIYPYSYGPHQMLNFVKTELGSYLIMAKHSGMYLEVMNYEFKESVSIVLSTRNATTQAQEWYIDSTGQGSVKIMSRLSGRCISIKKDNSFLYQMSCLNEAYQKWFLMPVC